jgi:PHD/YefM family antitoxin component YafN of YafNO toxin-antitoxin module
MPPELHATRADMNLNLAEDIMSVADFARGTQAHLAALATTQRPLVLRQDGKAAAVVLTMESYDEIAHEAYERKMDQQLKATLEAYAEGERGRPLEDVFNDLRQKHFGK